LLLLASNLLGGIGLFLLGMILMSDGLKAAAGNALQGILERSTGTTFRAFASGAGITALVQSSSATILATIGFVSAGLLTFPSALGVIVGAAVGTTSTGWIVSLLGLKFNVASVALPLIGAGALLRLFASGRAAHVGMALAGFGLIFVGIEMLRAGMGEVALQFDLGAIAGTTLLGGLQLVAIGVAMTVVLQSSSAAVALALTAVHTGAIDLHQAAFLVIGHNVGTTVTSALASIGGSVPARRTAVGHVLFNTFSGTVAFLAAGPLLALSTLLAGLGGTDEAAVVIAVFHTVFNVAGALVILPLLQPFARTVTRLIPERTPALTRHLDRTLLELPAVAVAAADRTIREIARISFEEALGLPQGRSPRLARLGEARAALDETHHFLGSIRSSRDARREVAQRHALLHAGDHLGRLINALRQAPAGGLPDVSEIRNAADDLEETFTGALAWLAEADGDSDALVEMLAQAAQRQAAVRRSYRAELLRRTATGEINPEEALGQLDLMRHIDRLLYHGWRAMHHLASDPEQTSLEPMVEESD
jgi:phosphate:Na+ symporter